jgi:hypothetical protein
MRTRLLDSGIEDLVSLGVQLLVAAFGVEAGTFDGRPERGLTVPDDDVGALRAA